MNILYIEIKIKPFELMFPLGTEESCIGSLDHYLENMNNGTYCFQIKIAF